jgi:hypothetical protein
MTDKHLYVVICGRTGSPELIARIDDHRPHDNSVGFCGSSLTRQRLVGRRCSSSHIADYVRRRRKTDRERPSRRGGELP